MYCPAHRRAMDERMVTMEKQISYTELRNIVEHNNLNTRWSVICWLIGYQNVVTESDWYNIRKLYVDNVIEG